jgi:DNA-directed RNA polymerase specialized sigma24 family protein
MTVQQCEAVASATRLLERAQGLAHRFSLAVCGHANDVDDATQEALIKAFRYVSTIQQPETFRTWRDCPPRKPRRCCARRRTT